MKRAGAACIAIVATLVCATLDAQRLAPAVLTSSTTSTVVHRLPPSPTDIPRAKDYTAEGAAAVFTTLGCALDQSGGHEDCAWKSLKRGTIGAVIGGLTSAFVGAVLSPTPSPRRGPQ